jgi:ABC-type Fe3+/spermidine/putrescine transport system ATPase subunit
VAGFIGVSNLIERDGRRVTVRPEKITLLADGQPDPPGAHAEAGLVRDVIYAGVLTRYVVELEAGGVLVVSRQNAESPALPGDGSGSGSAGDDGSGSGKGGAGIGRGDRVRIAWRAEQAFTIPQQNPGQQPGQGEG